MGRVDEAMRRAAEDAGTGEPAGKPAPVTPAVQRAATVVSLDAFPLETQDSRPTAVNGRSAEMAGPSPVTEVRPRPKLLPALSERIDVRLAQKTVVDDGMDPASREQYRRLATTLYSAQAEGELKVVMIASAVASEGKTLTATNLALTLSESYHRNVLLIDGDLRKPSLHHVFTLESEPGLSEGLTSSVVRKLPIHRVTEHLSVLTAGRPNANPMAALASDRMTQLIDEARESFEWVVIDTPPIGLLSDANLLAGLADGTLLVVKAHETPYDLVQRAVVSLGKSPLLGVVLNRTASGAVSNKYYGNYYGTPSKSTSAG